jgi:hypothetical protein
MAARAGVNHHSMPGRDPGESQSMDTPGRPLSDDDLPTRVIGAPPVAEPARATRSWRDLPWGWGAAILAVAVGGAWVGGRWTSSRGVPATPPSAPVERTTTPATADVPSPYAEPSPEQRATALAEAINAELRRIGLGDVSVRVATDGTTTVSGRMASAQERDELLAMIGRVDGVRSVRDAIDVPAPRAAPPEPVTPAPVAPPPVAKAPVAPPPRLGTPVPRVPAQPRTETTAAPPPPVFTPPAPAPTAPPVATITPPPPPPVATPAPAPRTSLYGDPAQVTRDVQRVLARIGLPEIEVHVDDSLQVTLRGTVDDPFRKAQAIAVARDATPSGRVRDQISVMGR